jgi:hypothetical protein
MMKAINKQLTATMITLLISCSMLFANTTGVTVHVLSDNEWQSIEDSAEMEAILDITDMPALRDNGLHVLTDQEWEAISYGSRIGRHARAGQHTNEQLVNRPYSHRS